MGKLVCLAAEITKQDNLYHMSMNILGIRGNLFIYPFVERMVTPPVCPCAS